MSKWHSGPPPHVGWWQASFAQDSESWRWWDGSLWSVSFSPRDPVQIIEIMSVAKVLSNADSIQWTDYWPENARVPRIDPRKA